MCAPGSPATASCTRNWPAGELVAELVVDGRTTLDLGAPAPRASRAASSSASTTSFERLLALLVLVFALVAAAIVFAVLVILRRAG